MIPGLSLSPDHELTTIVRQITGSNSAGKVSYGTESGLYCEAGIPTLVCGPGDIAQAHQPERVDRAGTARQLRRVPLRLTDRLLS